jgi:hypothetical protein
VHATWQGHPSCHTMSGLHSWAKGRHLPMAVSSSRRRNLNCRASNLKLAGSTSARRARASSTHLNSRQPLKTRTPPHQYEPEGDCAVAVVGTRNGAWTGYLSPTPLRRPTQPQQYRRPRRPLDLPTEGRGGLGTERWIWSLRRCARSNSASLPPTMSLPKLAFARIFPRADIK